MENIKEKDNPEIISNATSLNNKKANVPNLRFREFSQKWQKKQFIYLAKAKARIGWQGLRQDEFMDNGDYYLITGTDFLSDRIKFDTCKYISKYRYEQDPNIQVKNGDILVTKDGSIGKVAFVQDLDKPATLNAGVYVIRSITDLSQEFLFHYLKAPFLLNFSSKASTGGTIKHLNQSVLEKFEVPYSSIKEQEKIATFLTTIDIRIETQSKIIEDLELLKKAIMDYIFLKNNSTNEYCFNVLFSEFKTLNLNKLIQYTIGKEGIKSMKDDGVRYNIDKHITFHPNTLILGIGIDEVGVSTNITGCCSPIYKTYSINTDYSETRYIYYFMRRILYHYRRFITQKSTRREFEFDYRTLKKIIIKLPPKHVQSMISDILDSVTLKIQKEKDILNAYKKQKGYLLQNMFI